MDLLPLVSIALAFFIVAVAPGPATISNAVVAMSYGRKVALTYGAGLSFGLAFWGVVAASGLGAIIQSSVHVLMGLKILGGMYLFWLAVQSARAAIHPEGEEAVATQDENWFLRGLILNASNPKAVVAWMAALSVGLDSNANVHVLITATAICIGIGFAVYVFYSVAFSLGGVMRFYTRVKRAVHGVMAGLLALFGISLLRSAFNR